MFDRRLGHPGRFRVLGDELWGSRWLSMPQRLYDCRVDASAFTQQQAARGGITNQRVLESVCGVRGVATSKDQFGTGQTFERLSQLRLGSARDGRQSRIVKL